MLFYLSANFFRIKFFEKFFHEFHKRFKQIDPDQARHFVRPDLGPNCLQRLSGEDTSRQRVNCLFSPNEKVSSIRYKLACAYSQDSNRSADPHSLIRVLDLRQKKSWNPWLPIVCLSKTDQTLGMCKLI